MKATSRFNRCVERRSAILSFIPMAALLFALRAPAATPAAGDLLPPSQVEGTGAVPAAIPNETNLLHLNFRGAPIALILDYLSDAAGFIINQEAELHGTIDAWSKDPVTREEAVALLNSALRKNGAGVIREGRILKIVKLDNAKTADLPVVQGNDPDAVEKSEEVITQIIPVRYANATQLVNNLQVLLPSTASLSVNESANSLILVATKSEIRRVLKIISALDSSIASVSTIKILPLRYSDAKELATVIQQLFSTSASGQNGNGNGRNGRFNMAGGFGPFGGPGGFGPPGGGTGADTAGGDTSRNSKVTVVADEHSNALVVSAPADLVTTITEMVKQVDQPMTDITEMRVFRLKHADPGDLADQLSQLFPDESKATANQNDTPFRFGPPSGPFGGPFGGTQAQAASSSGERSKKKGRVIAAADARTSSLLVSADSTLMPQIGKMIEELDANAARQEVVKVYDLKNADPQNVNQILQDLFNRNGATRNNNNNRNSLLGQNNPLSTRETQQQTTAQTGFGSQAGGAGGLGGAGAGTGAGGGGGGGF